MTRKHGVRYTKEQKEAVVKRMMPPNNESVSQIAEEMGISDASLYKWRKKGLYREQIDAWKRVCLQANGQAFDQAKQINGALKEEQKRAKQLEKELQKKEKALAEAAALLLLRKKAQAIWGDPEEE